MALAKEIKKLVNHLYACLDLTSFANPYPKISANILCKDNLKSIKLCLDSIKEHVYELVIIDTGSTDGTYEFLEKYLPKNFANYQLIKENEFKGYSFHRNQAISASSGNWILVLDSDEFLSKRLQDKLHHLCSSKIFSAYKLFRYWIDKIEDNKATAIFTKKFRGRYKSIIRLFRKLPGVEYRGDIHEAVFGLEHKRIQTVNEKIAPMYHVDVAINSYKERQAKVLNRELLLKGSGHPEEYLPEDYGLKAQEILAEDFELISKTMGMTSQNNT